MYIAEDELRGGGDVQTIGTHNMSNSVIERNKSIITKFSLPIYNRYQNWRLDPDMSRHYWTASFFLPVGSIFVLGIVVLLMVLFKRHPHTAAIVAAILVIIMLTIVVSLNHEPVYS